MPRRAKPTSSQKKAGPLRRFFASVWLFPVLLFVVVTLLTACKISGTSLGVYYPILYGQSQKNPDMIAGHPQGVRSDEWLVNTQLTIAQKAADYPLVNPNIEGGENMSVVGDAPYKGWSEAFRPQNLAFFVLPFAFAFAFKWWLLLYLVIVSCYFFVLRFFPGKRLMAALLGTAIGLSPFLFWWYQTGTLAPIFYGFFILLMGMRIIDSEKVIFLKKYDERYSQSINVLVLGYLLAAFGLILYPAFQIPIALSVTAFLAGYLLERYGLGRKLISREALIRIGCLVFSLVLAGIVVVAFLHTRSDTIHTVENTVYPGHLNVKGGGLPGFELFSTYLQPLLERAHQGANYFTSQSEASNFVLLWPFLMVPGFVLLYVEWRQKRRLNWPLLLIQLLSLLFIADLFIAGPDLLYKSFFLNKVQHRRLFIGLGFLGVIQLLLVMKSLAAAKISRMTLNWSAALYTLLCLAICLITGNYVRTNWPHFVHSWLLIGFFALFFSAIIYCFLSRRFLLGAALLFVFSFGSTFRIHPLYRGLEPVYPSKLIRAIDRTSKPGDTWVVLDDGFFKSFPDLAGRGSLTGVQLYPNLGLWKQDGEKYSFIYDRYAHVIFSTETDMQQNFELVGTDNFKVKFACNQFVQQHVQYALSGHPIDYSCTQLVGQVQYPAKTFYIYRVN